MNVNHIIHLTLKNRPVFEKNYHEIHVMNWFMVTCLVNCYQQHGVLYCSDD